MRCRNLSDTVGLFDDSRKKNIYNKCIKYSDRGGICVRIHRRYTFDERLIHFARTTAITGVAGHKRCLSGTGAFRKRRIRCVTVGRHKTTVNVYTRRSEVDTRRKRDKIVNLHDCKSLPRS